jgi:uncharacterized protein (DUF1778 family)
MLALLKNNRTSSEKDSANSWHVDFRNQVNLPDIKTVRTGFAVNTSIFAVLGGLLIFTVHREITVSNLATEIAELEKSTATAKAENEKAFVLYQQYIKEEKILKEAQVFDASSFDFVAFITAFSQQMPPGVKIKRVDYKAKDQPITISGEIAGRDVEATAKADQFSTALKNSEALRGIIANVSMPKIDRDNTTDSLVYELVLKLK